MDLSWDDLTSLSSAAITAAGADAATADALTDAIVGAERRGKTAVGVAHLFDYLDAFGDGRLNGRPRPAVRHDRSAVITVSADDGIAQLAYRAAAPLLIDAARRNGIAILSVRDAFTAGELGHYTLDLASTGLVALAGSNSPALMSLYDVPAAVAGTNPVSFAVPTRPAPRMIDQASSNAAWVRIRDAAEAGTPIPADWALDSAGNATTDAAAALLGPLLPFGGVKGSNIAMMIELLSVLSGASFSLDSSPFPHGTEPHRVGMFVIAMDPAAFGPGYVQHAEAHFARLEDQYGISFGRHRAEVPRLRLAEHVYERLHAAGQCRQASSV